MTDEQIFSLAIQLDRKKRDKALTHACQSAEQRTRVEALLAAHDKSDSLLDTEAMAPAGETIVEQPIRKTIGDFEIIRELGRGGMGVVYEARQKSLKRRVALKVLSSGLGLSSKAILRFRREAEAAGKLHHTNIVPIYTTGEDKGVHYYAMELIDGPSLDAVIRDLKQETTEGTEESAADADVPSWLQKTALYDASGPAPVQTDCPSSSSSSTITQGTKYFDHVATMIAEVSDALDHAHEHGVIHRDIKPSNLLLAPDGRLSINDFGLARMLEQPGMTMTGEFVGSPLYMSPEQITAGRVTIDHRTDIYSLGATLYELITLQPPFPGRTRDQVLTQILHKVPRSPRQLNRKVPTDLDTICMKAIEKDPDRRYQSAAQLAKDLRAYVNRHAISARRVSPVGKTFRWIMLHPSQACLATLLLAALIASLAIYRSTRARELKSAQEMHLMYCMGGDFDSARSHMLRAEELGADEGWLLLAEGQIEMYLGNYDRAFKLLEEASQNGASRVPTQATRAIARLYAGDEREHERDLQYLLKALGNHDLEPESSQDYLFLSMAFQYINPEISIGFLSFADKTGDLHELVRCSVYSYAATYEPNEEKAIEYAESAQAAGNSISNLFSTSPLAVIWGIRAETVAAMCFGRADDLKRQQQAFARAQELAGKELAERHQMSTYLLLDEVESDDKVTEFLKGISNEGIDYYTRTYRMIDCIRTGDVEQVRLDADLIERDREFKYPFVALTRLSNAVSDSDVDSIRSDFREHCGKVLQRYNSNVFHADFFWAAAKLLDLPEEVQRCEREVELRAATYEDLYIGATRQAIIDVAHGNSASEIRRPYDEDRRILTYRLFALGVESLSNGDRSVAKAHFDECSREGNPGFYVCQFARAVSAKLTRDPTWPRSIDVKNSFGARSSKDINESAIQ